MLCAPIPWGSQLDLLRNNQNGVILHNTWVQQNILANTPYININYEQQINLPPAMVKRKYHAESE